MYTTQQLVTLARSIADMAQSKYITQDDEKSFLNEAYKSIYSKYAQSGGEFWVSETVLTLTDANLAPYGKGREYLVDLPVDFYQLRGVDYDLGSSWSPMRRVPWSQRDFIGAEPGYRLKNSKLLVLSSIRPQIRVSYYPAPVELDVDATPVDYPLAEMYDVMAYEMALNFVRKQTDQNKLALVQQRTDTLWGRFEQILKQDQYQFERVQNDYKNSNVFWGY